MKKLVVLASAIVCSIPAFAFNVGQSQADINKEVAGRIDKKETLETISAAAKAAGVVVNPIALALSFYGSHEAVLAGMMAAGYDTAAVVNALVAQGGNRNALVQMAISKGADPTTLTAATAAGGNAGNAGNAGGIAGGFGGFSGNSFSSSRASTLGGSGKSGVSPS